MSKMDRVRAIVTESNIPLSNIPRRGHGELMQTWNRHPKADGAHAIKVLQYSDSCTPAA